MERPSFDDSPFASPQMEIVRDPPVLGFVVGFAVALLGIVLVAWVLLATFA